jgi:AraC-like DNA-binding protein
VQRVSITPARPLGDFIERFWFFSDAPPHRKERIVPSGTVELVFNLAEDQIRIYDAKQHTRCNRFPGAVFSGTYAQPFVIDTMEHASIVGVHFKPGGAFPFLGLPANEFTNSHVELETLWGKSASELRERLCAAANPSQRFHILENTLITCLNGALNAHRAVQAALNIFERGATGTTIREVAAHLGLSERHFINVFSNQVGMTPKLYCRVRRFQRALESMRKSTMPDWADVVVGCGYFDQSHFINDFRTFSGLSPTEYLRQRSECVLTNHVPLAA